jgi:hypothetical protein
MTCGGHLGGSSGESLIEEVANHRPEKILSIFREQTPEDSAVAKTKRRMVTDLSLTANRM